MQNPLFLLRFWLINVPVPLNLKGEVAAPKFLTAHSFAREKRKEKETFKKPHTASLQAPGTLNYFRQFPTSQPQFSSRRICTLPLVFQTPTRITTKTQLFTDHGGPKNAQVIAPSILLSDFSLLIINSLHYKTSSSRLGLSFSSIVYQHLGPSCPVFILNTCHYSSELLSGIYS